jgi:steroid delta-isomerase-like uncharacterized protein
MFSHINRILMGCIILIALGGLFQKATAATEEEMRSVMQDILDALNAHDVAQMDSYWTDDIVYDFVHQPPPLNGKEEVAALFGGLFQGIPDLHSTQTRILVSGNIMVTEAVVTGTHLGELSGIPATGNSLQMVALHIWEFEGDKVKHVTEYLDMASMLMQIGVMPAAELDPALLVPSITLPEAEPIGLAPLEANAEANSLWNAHDLSVYAKVVHPDAEIQIAPLGLTLSREGYIASQELYLLGFPDLNMEDIRTIDMGDGWVLNEILWKGTHTGLYFDILATGRPVEIMGAFLARYDSDGLITNLNIYFDNLTVLAQLGLFPPPDPEANKAIDRRVLEEIWNQGNLDIIDDIYTPGYVFHVAGQPDIQGPDGVRQFVTMYHSAFPDLNYNIEDQIAEGDIVVSRWTCTGTHQGEFMGIPPTGKQGIAGGMIMRHIVDGKSVEEWSVWDALGMMEQLGVVPPTRQDYTWGAPSQVIGDAGEPVTNTALVLYVNEKFWNEKYVNVLEETHSPDSIAHNPIIPVNPLPFYVYKQVALLHIAAFPDIKVTTEHIIAEGDKVVIHWTATGTHQGELMGIPASGRQITWTGMTIYRFADSKIVETWWAYDAMGMMQQITAPPESEPPQE